MKLTILGCAGAIPAYGRFPTSQVLDVGATMFLIDCGEGAQMRMQTYGIRSNRIDHVFISHTHGDHYFGLIGWINSLALLGRTKPLFIYAPELIKQVIDLQLQYNLPYAIVFKALQPNESEVLWNTEKYEVISFPVIHSVPTHGIRIRVKRNKRILNKAAVSDLEIPVYFYKRLTNGEDYTKADGTIIKNESVTLGNKPDLQYAYCADTLYTETILPYIDNADLLYHEATYTEQYLDKATERNHSTAKQAATIGKLSNAKQLIIGHYSSKYKLLDQHLIEAKEVFNNTILAFEGMEIEVK